MNKHFSIAIDGPAGAGKSTIAKLTARKLGFIYVDTGAMYRAMALYLLREGTDPADMRQIAEKSAGARITIEHRNGEQVVLLFDEDVTGLLRSEEVGNMASVSSVCPQLREKLVELQRELADKEDVVMDGRDIGTVVLPDADIKIFLTASVEVRTGRRVLELRQKGENPDPEIISADIRERDYRDSHREVSPLRQAEDAVLLDASDLTIQEVLDRILLLTEAKRVVFDKKEQ